LVAAHPTKNAAEDSLIPYGGGASINESDGNLTLWSDNASIKLYWNRVRGPEFNPRYFRIEKLSSPDIIDNKERQILLPVCRPMSEEAAEQRQEAKGATNLEVLKSFVSDPADTERERALRLGLVRSTLQYRLKSLVKKGYLEEAADGKHRLTPKGRKEILHLAPEGGDE
jgi:hypothetical protein